jgi:two-component system cell cycle response regulator
MTGGVLVVDDVSANIKLLEARLAAEYFTVLTASSGAEALKVLETEGVDLVLLDVMMPAWMGSRSAGASRRQRGRRIFLS